MLKENTKNGTMNGLQFAPHLCLVLREAATEHDFICIPLKVESESIPETATAQHQHTEKIKIMFVHVLVTSGCCKLFAAKKSMKLCIMQKYQKHKEWLMVSSSQIIPTII